MGDFYRTRRVTVKYVRALRHTDGANDAFIVQETDRVGRPLSETVRKVGAAEFLAEFEPVHKGRKKAG